MSECLGSGCMQGREPSRCDCETYSAVRETISQISAVPDHEIWLDHHLIADIGLDGYDLGFLVTELCEQFRIELSDSIVARMESCKTVGDVVSLFDECLNGKARV
jgi:acyl carrier protein